MQDRLDRLANFVWIEEAAEILGVSVNEVLKRIKAGVWGKDDVMTLTVQRGPERRDYRQGDEITYMIRRSAIAHGHAAPR